MARLVERAQIAGVSATLDVWEGMWHVFQGYVAMMPEATEAMRQGADFIAEHTAADGSTERNKANVVAFYDLMFNRSQPAEAIERYAGATYIQHNPEVGDGKQAFIDYFERMAADYPTKKVEFKRVLADGDHVILHCHQTWPDGLEYAGIDIFRLDDAGKVVEHWDVLQEIPDHSANGNSIF